MSQIKELTINFLNDESGTETVEWAIVAGLLIVAAAAVWSQIGERVATLMGELLTALGGGGGT